MTSSLKFLNEKQKAYVVFIDDLQDLGVHWMYPSLSKSFGFSLSHENGSVGFGSALVAGQGLLA